MPRRCIPLVAGEFYHVYNRGVARQPIFLRHSDYERFMLAFGYYRFAESQMSLSRLLDVNREERERWLAHMTQRAQQRVSIVSFALMPNHFHFLLRVLVDGGLSTFMGQLANSYSRYFNVIHDRVGPVFQGPFKAIRIETDAQMIHLSRYIHLNPLTGHVVRETEWRSYPWSSFSEFLRGRSSLVDLAPVMRHFPSPTDYERFVEAQATLTHSLRLIRHLIPLPPQG